MSSPPTFSSLPTELRLYIFHLAASPDSEPTYPWFFTDGRFYFGNVLDLSDDIPPHPGHPLSEPCPSRTGIYDDCYGVLRGLFHRSVWNPKEEEKADDYYEECVEGTVYKTRHALLHTCRLAREVALQEWIRFVKGLNKSNYEYYNKVRRQVLEELRGLLSTVRSGEVKGRKFLKDS